MLHSYKVFNYPPYTNGLVLDIHSISDINHANHVVKDCDGNIVRNVAVFGLNDSGKSMFVKSFESLKHLILADNYDSALLDLFDDIRNEHKWLRYELEFSNSGFLYTYDITIDSDNGIDEYLYLNFDGQNKLIFSNISSRIEILDDNDSMIEFSLDVSEQERGLYSH